MKTKILSTFAIVAMLFTNSCKGPEGPIGPVGSTGTAGVNGTNGGIGATGTAGANGKDGGTGATGATGSTGAAGANGKDGNANVVYSEWITPTWVSSGEGSDRFYLNQRSTANALITQDAIDKAVIYTYWKVKALNYNQDKSEYELVERISPNNGYSYFKISGRTSNNWQDFQYMQNSFESQIGVNYLSVNSSVYRFGYALLANGTYSNINTLIPDFAAGKGFTFYNELVKDISKYRVIVVYGSTKGRLASVNMKDYNEVKKAFNLKD